MSSNETPTASPEISPLARFAGSFLLAGALFALCAVMAYGTYGIKSQYGWAFTVGTVICGALYWIGRGQQEKISKDAFAKQRALLGVNAITSVLLVGVLLVGVNYIAGRRQKTFDLTKNKVNSLAPQTQDVLSKLKKPVQLKLYALRVEPSTKALLDNYARESDNVKVDYVDVAQSPMDRPPSFTGQPLLVASEVVTPPTGKSSTAAPLSGARQEISQIDEQGVTSALMKLGDPQPKTVYFLSGHGEVDPNQAPLAQEALKGQNYQVKTFSLIGKNAKIPADAAAVIVVAPQMDLASAEVKALESYIGNKGHLVLMGGLAQSPQPNWTSLLKNVGLKWSNGYVIDPQYGQFAVGQRGDITRHPIVRGTSADVIFPAAQAYTTVTPAPTGVTVTPIFESSPNSQQVTVSQGLAGQPGSFVLAAAVEKGDSRVLVVGSGQMVTDEVLSRYGDKSFFLAGVNWVVGNDALVSIPPKPPVTNTLEPPGRTGQLFMIFSMLAMPVLALLVGGIVWFRRK